MKEILDILAKLADSCHRARITWEQDGKMVSFTGFVYPSCTTPHYWLRQHIELRPGYPMYPEKIHGIVHVIRPGDVGRPAVEKVLFNRGDGAV